MLGYRARQRVLDGNNGGIDRSAFDEVKYLDRARARDHLATRQHALRGFMAESAPLSLYGNSHGGLPGQSKVARWDG
jgi:hypothetical protein